MSGRLVVVGDALLDRDVDGEVERLSPEGPIPVLDEQAATSRPGGAALAATLAAAAGRGVTLVAALGQDRAGRELRALLADAGVEVVDLGLDGPTPEKTRYRCDGRVLLRVDRSGAGPDTFARDGADAAEAFRDPAAVVVSDYGRGLTAVALLRALLRDAATDTPVVWDPHPRGNPPVAGTCLATPNAAEAAQLAPGVPGQRTDRTAVAGRARELARRWEAEAVGVTLGPQGVLLVADGSPPVLSPARPATGGDPCGAGDCFAATVAGLLGEGVLLVEAVHEGVRTASSFVARGGAAGRPEIDAHPASHASAADAVVAEVRAAGGAVVMTGGCFDLLHAGHVRLLEAARELGDCLVVCLNSDESVRSLKGGGRPVVCVEDRAALLLALGCVDGVVVFEEETPQATLERFRPDVFVKGGDYAFTRLPEAETVAAWGGEVVILPYEEGRSTTRLLEEVLGRAR